LGSIALYSLFRFLNMSSIELRTTKMMKNLATK